MFAVLILISSIYVRTWDVVVIVVYMSLCVLHQDAGLCTWGNGLISQWHIHVTSVVPWAYIVNRQGGVRQDLVSSIHKTSDSTVNIAVHVTGI
jgi:hypothetical protein